MPTYSLLDINGKTIFKDQLDKLDYFITNESKILFKVKIEEKFGIIDVEKNEIIKPLYDFISELEYGKTKKYYHVELNGKIGYLDETGKIIIEIIYEKSYSQPKFIDGIILLKRNGIYYYINENGEKIIELKATEVQNFHNGLALIKKGGKYGYINLNGEEVIKFDYSDAKYFSSKYPMAQVATGSFWGVINNLGDIIVDIKYDKIEFRNDDEVIIVKKGKLFGIVHPFRKKILTDCIYKEINNQSNDFFIVKKDKLWGVINLFDEEILPFIFDEIICVEKLNKIFGRKNKKWNVYCLNNPKEPEFVCEDFQIVNESLILKQKGIYKIYKNEQIVSIEIDSIAGIQNDNIFFKKNNKSGILKESGRIVIQNDYDEIDYSKLFRNDKFYNKDLFIVKNNGQFGIINIKNEIICEIKFDKVEINKGVILNCTDNLWGFTIPLNNIKSEIIYDKIKVEIVANEPLLICSNINIENLNTNYFIHRDDKKSDTFSIVLLSKEFKGFIYLIAIGRVSGGLYGELITKFKNINNWDITKGEFATDFDLKNWEYEYEGDDCTQIDTIINENEKVIFQNLYDELSTKYIYYTDNETDENPLLREEVLKKLNKSEYLTSSSTWVYKNLSKHWGLSYKW